MQLGQVSKPFDCQPRLSASDCKDYSASKSFPLAQTALRDLEAYGFIYQRPQPNGEPSDQFYPTHLATSLCSGDTVSLGSATADEKRFLILETNYKIYAYTCELNRAPNSPTDDQPTS